MKLISSKYGSGDQIIDVTNKLSTFQLGERILIPSSVNLNVLFGDPCVNVVKKLVLNVIEGNTTSEIILEEYGSFLRETFDSNLRAELDVNYEEDKNCASHPLVPGTYIRLIAEMPPTYHGPRGVVEKLQTGTNFSGALLWPASNTDTDLGQLCIIGGPYKACIILIWTPNKVGAHSYQVYPTGDKLKYQQEFFLLYMGEKNNVPLFHILTQQPDHKPVAKTDIV